MPRSYAPQYIQSPSKDAVRGCAVLCSSQLGNSTIYLLKGYRRFIIRWTPRPVIVAIRDNKDYIRVLLYSYYTAMSS